MTITPTYYFFGSILILYGLYTLYQSYIFLRKSEVRRLLPFTLAVAAVMGLGIFLLTAQSILAVPWSFFLGIGVIVFGLFLLRKVFPLKWRQYRELQEEGGYRERAALHNTTLAISIFGVILVFAIRLLVDFLLGSL